MREKSNWRKQMRNIRTPALFAGLVFCSFTALPTFAQTIFEDLKLTALVEGQSFRLGNSVAISGGLSLIGGYRADDGVPRTGAAYVFDMTSANEQRILTASDGAAEDWYGWAVDVSGTVAIIGAPADDDDGTNSGSAYIVDITTGQELFKLTASNADAGDEFGRAVAISDQYAVIGAAQDDTVDGNAGMAYVFDVATGQELFQLTQSNPDSGTEFGRAVAISGNLAVITSNGQFGGSLSIGAAYVFDLTTGQELYMFTASDATFGDKLGRSVAASGNLAIVGAEGDDDNGSASGSAYVFDLTTGQELVKLLPLDGAANDLFGFSVSISGPLAIAGSPNDDDFNLSAGSAYVFDIATGQQLHKLIASDSQIASFLGSSVAISGNIAIGGAPAHDGTSFNTNETGAAYVYQVDGGADCPADLSGDGALNFFDVSAFLTAFGAGDAAADFTGDGVFNFFDVSAFLIAFAEGCP
jgi:FG-GAP repeat